MEPSEVLAELTQQVVSCNLCGLSNGRKRSVPGEGPINADVMLIGEGPGFYENEQGRPFVGPAGHLLDDLLKLGGVRRQEVFITNVVKCRPPNNRDPLPEEIEACTSHYLNRQIETINPKVIVTLGRFSMGLFLPGARITAVHGHARWVKDRFVVAMFHPAAALHQPALMSQLKEDFSHLSEWVAQGKKLYIQKAEKAAALLLEERKENELRENQSPTQLSLF